MESSSVKINFQADKVSDHMLIIRAYVNYGYREINPKIGELLRRINLLIPSDNKPPENYFNARPGIEHNQEVADLLRKYEILLKDMNSAVPNPDLVQISKVLNLCLDEKTNGQIHRKNIFNYRPCRITTGITIPKVFWDNKLKKAKGTYSYVNERLKEFKQYTEQLYVAISDSGKKLVEPEKLAEQIKLHITSKFKEGEQILSGKKTTEKRKRVSLPKVVLPGYYGDKINGIPTRIVDYVDWKIEDITQQGFINSKISADTCKVYKRFANRIIEYQESNKTEIDIRAVKIEDIKTFISFFETRGKKEDGSKYKWNYLLALKKEYHNILKKAQADGIPVSLNLSDKFFSNSWEKQNDPYLTFQHLQKLKHLTFPLSDENMKEMKSKFGFTISTTILANVRDMFIVACNSGARFSDLKNFKHLYYNEKDGWYFEYISEKTEINVKIPIRDKWIISLYERKYKKEFWLDVAEQTFNEAIKVICYFAGLTEPVNRSIKDTKTGKLKKDEPPLYSLITSKTARKTFASNEVKEFHTPLSVVAIWTGHANEKSLKNYIQLSDAEFYKIAQRTTELLMKAQLKNK